MTALTPWRLATVVGIAGAGMVIAVSTGSPAGAGYYCEQVTGTFAMFSDGRRAQTREVYHDEASVHETWTISSSCDDAFDCTGTVVSAQGWTAPVHCLSGVWTVKRSLDNWEPCRDGSSWPGNQLLQFWTDSAHPGTYTGMNKTIGVSGACGMNLPLTVQMPLTLTP